MTINAINAIIDNNDNNAVNRNNEKALGESFFHIMLYLLFFLGIQILGIPEEVRIVIA